MLTKRFASACAVICAGVMMLAALPQAARAQTDLSLYPDRLVPIPAKARRHSLTFDTTQWVVVDNKVRVQLAPGVRIYGTDNMLKLYGSLQGTATAKVLREETTGMLLYVWILTPKEIATPDPKPVTQ